MSKEEKVISYYVLCNKLKHIIRTGWQTWKVEAKRLESVAEHIYGVQMLAVAMYSEYDYDIDLRKVILMLAIHELEEIVIGDLTQFQISKKEKRIIGHKAVENILKNLTEKENLKKLILEFDQQKTKEAIFAHFCDKLECDLQCKLYDEDGYVDLTKQEENSVFQEKTVKELLSKGLSWSEMWLKFSQEKYKYDDNFKAVSNYALTHKIK